MERIEQRTGNDCLRCCVAMVLHLPYEEVPHFVEAAPTSWSGAFRAWLAERGLDFLRVGHDIDETPAGVPVIAIGLGFGGCMHAVVHHYGVIDPGISVQGLAAEPKHRLVILPLVTAAPLAD